MVLFLFSGWSTTPGTTCTSGWRGEVQERYFGYGSQRIVFSRVSKTLGLTLPVEVIRNLESS